MSEKNRLLYQAFTDHDDEEIELNEESMKNLNSLKDQCIPFYVDHYIYYNSNKQLNVIDFNLIVSSINV